MTRTLSGGESEESGVEAVWLLEAVFWDGSSEQILRFATAGDDVEVDADGDGSPETYEGAGDLKGFGPVASETQDRRAQGTRIELSGVDTVVMSTLLENDFRGRRMRVWRARIEDGAVSDTRLVHRGVQLEDYEIREERPDSPDEDDQAPTITITTRSVSRVAAMQGRNAVQATVASHNAMLARAGESTGDSFFRYLPNLGRFFWGSEATASATDGSNDGSSAGGGRDPQGDPGGPILKP